MQYKEYIVPRKRKKPSKRVVEIIRRSNGASKKPAPKAPKKRGYKNA
jgi:hypothetical protein